MPSSENLRSEPEALQAVLVGIAYLLAFQFVFLVIPFTSETLWLWFLGAWEAIGRGEVVAFLLDPEWWLALAFPVSVLVTGAIGAYAYLVNRNPVSAVIAVGFLTALVTTELVFVGHFEWAILYIALSPVVAVFAVLSHLIVPRLFRRRVTR